MSKKTNTVATIVRMFDGEKWDTYKEGGRKHLAAQERRAAFEQKKADQQRWNKGAAEWARSEGVVPAGQAWAMIKATADIASLDVKSLRKANKADGLKMPKPTKVVADAQAKRAAKAGVVEATVETEVVEVVETKPKGKKAARKARSAAARKGWETRRANLAAQAQATEPTEPTEPKKSGKKGKGKTQIAATVDLAEATFRANLEAVGLSDAQIDRAWALKG